MAENYGLPAFGFFSDFLQYPLGETCMVAWRHAGAMSPLRFALGESEAYEAWRHRQCAARCCWVLTATVLCNALCDSQLTLQDFSHLLLFVVDYISSVTRSKRLGILRQ
jgi:hypothetical protein